MTTTPVEPAVCGHEHFSDDGWHWRCIKPPHPADVRHYAIPIARRRTEEKP